MHRTILTTSLALALGCGTLFAQQQTQPTPDPNAPQTTAPAPHRHHAPNPQRQAVKMSKELGLTPDQTARVEPILATRDQQMQALMQNQQLAPQDRHQQMRTINQQTQQQLATVLSPDQLAQLKAIRHEHHERHNPNGAPNTQPS